MTLTVLIVANVQPFSIQYINGQCYLKNFHLLRKSAICFLKREGCIVNL